MGLEVPKIQPSTRATARSWAAPLVSRALALRVAIVRGVTMPDLEAQFTAAMFDIYRLAKSEAKYNATIFLQMITENGGGATAKTLINALQPTDGYTALYLRKRLDLTVEAVVVEHSRWHSLFTEEELDRARRRLIAYGYQPKISN